MSTAEFTVHVDLTEIEEFEVDRVDLVKTPANGFPLLLKKGVNPEDAPDDDYEQMARATTDPVLQKGYRKLAQREAKRSHRNRFRD